MKYSTYLLGIIYLGLAFSALVYARPVLRGHPDDWPQWRGPNRDGISAEKGILKSWDDSGPETIWRVASGDGYAGIAVANGRLFTAWGGGRSAYLVCYDAATGKQLWKTKLGANSFLDQGNGPRATPLVDGDLVYMIDGFAKLFAVRAQSGDVAWQRDLEREYGSRVPRWGYSSSPMVLGDKLIVTVGGKSDYAYMAFNKANGAEIWHAGNDEPGYSSPILVTIAGTQQLIFFSASGLHGVSPADGTIFWKYGWRTSYDVNAANPIFIGPDKIFISSSYGTGAAVIQISKNGNQFSAETVWKNRIMKNHFNSSVLWKGYIYGFDNGILKCIEAQTGEEMWKARGFQKGQLILADGHLIVLGEQGMLAVAEATPKAYIERARSKVLSGRCWTMPTLANGILFVRNQSAMLALKFSK
ncbi:PQQ-binding-like beta-propeller repeat protein [candidate division KSB1 bacterium]|nr:PQQ-binding-like beta-propeller repeat protein [candidate division KSB1 bacterium]